LSWNDLGTGSGLAYTNPSTSGFRDSYTTLKYPFVNWTNQYTTYPSSINLPDLESTFRPFINIKYILDRIFNAPNTPFSYSSDFFDTADFEKLYMDFNWGSDTIINDNIGQGSGENDNTTGITAGLTYSALHYDVETFTAATELNYNFSTSRFTASFDNQKFFISGVFNFRYTDWTSGQLGSMGWEKYDSLGVATGYFPINNQLFAWGSATFGTLSSSFNQTVTLNTGESLRPSFVRYDAAVTLTQMTTQELAAFAPNSTTVTTGTSTTSSDTILQNLRGELGQWDFIKGLMTMFNLVALSDESNPNNIIIEPYADVFIAPSLTTAPLNWTDKIDVSEMKLEPLTELNKNTIFKFVEDDDDFAFNQYKRDVGGHLYGSKKYNAGNEFNILDGLDEIVAEPFAATVVKPLMSQYPNLITPALYSYNSDDGTSEGFENSPRIMYNNGIKSTGINCYVPAQNGSGAVYLTSFLQFSHLSDVPTVTGSIDFHFGECQLLVGASTPNNLFSMYWLPYYNELYNPNTRIMTIKVNLSPSDINTFKFNDTVLLKNRVFRVNKIDYKPNDLAKVEFILIP
jgi:hypothetical protein